MARWNMTCSFCKQNFGVVDGQEEPNWSIEGTTIWCESCNDQDLEKPSSEPAPHSEEK